MDVAGRDVTRWLRLLLRKEGTDLHRTSEFEIVREIKEKACYLATNVVKEEANENDKLIYPLPDGSRLDIGTSRFRAPEILFRPELIGEEWPGIAQLVNDSIRDFVRKSDHQVGGLLAMRLISHGSLLLTALVQLVPLKRLTCPAHLTLHSMANAAASLIFDR
ncbi:hypothetical protein RB195_018557 [Necator americanus]|uniref:Uncharacterized protein n=1 Tax=Necator americanus TaxID=51031 RepID=A0ABR1CE05_NECAM